MSTICASGQLSKNDTIFIIDQLGPGLKDQHLVICLSLSLIAISHNKALFKAILYLELMQRSRGDKSNKISSSCQHINYQIFLYYPDLRAEMVVPNK